MASDRGYSNLLNRLHRPSSTLPLQAMQASISHYLANTQPSPTPLAATVIGSQVFQPFSYAKLDAACTAFRHAVHIKIKLFRNEEKRSSSVFLRSLDVRVSAWARAVMKGLQGGQAMMRFACCAGLLMGLEDLEASLKMKEGRLRGRVEDELVFALAEVMDLYSSSRGSVDWENEFHRNTDGEVDAIELAFIIASQALPLVSVHKLTALPLSTFLQLLLSTIASAFQNGRFVQHFDKSFVVNAEVESSQFATSLKSLSSSPIYAKMGPLAKLYARTISAATESRDRRLWSVMNDTLLRLDNMVANLEADWQNNPMVDITDKNDIDPLIRDLMSTLWAVVKTFLFTTVMITQSITTATTYLPSPSKALPPSLALSVLRTLSPLSFVISQFGGVASTSQGGFSELRRVFYSALDVLSIDAVVSEKFVLELCSRVSMRSQVMENAKKAFALACVEQLVPTLGEGVIEDVVFPLCLPHLSDPTHRETYESAHSVVLAILALHAQRVGDGSGMMGIQIEDPQRSFAERLVPFYTRCLLENSYDGGLVTAQLRLAFAALVRSAGSSGSNSGDALAWFCIQSLLHATGSEDANRESKSSLGVRLVKDEDREGGRRHKLHLTLVSTLPSLPLRLLPRVLDEMKRVIVLQTEKGKKMELVEAVLDEILEKVGDQEKAVVISWLLENNKDFGGDRTGDAVVAPRL